MLFSQYIHTRKLTIVEHTLGLHREDGLQRILVHKPATSHDLFRPFFQAV